MVVRHAMAFCLALSIALAGAEEAEFSPSRPQTYTVVKGDTLWSIAGKFLRDPRQWPEVWTTNPGIRNPGLIYPGDVLGLDDSEGKPRLRIVAPSDIRLSPQVRSDPLAEAIPLLPMESIRPFMTRPRMISSAQREMAPYVVSLTEERIAGGAGDSIYVRSIPTTAIEFFTVFRAGQPYQDAESGEILGYEATYVGDAQLVSAGDPGTLTLLRTDREVLIGDQLLPVEGEKLDLYLHPHVPRAAVQAHIISVLDGVSQIGQYTVVVIDKGAVDGIETGHVLDIYQAGRKVRDPFRAGSGDYGVQDATVSLPKQKAGTLLVFKPFDRISYALVMNATRALHLFDLVQGP